MWRLSNTLGSSGQCSPLAWRGSRDAWASAPGSICNPGVVAVLKDTSILLSSMCLKQGTSHLGNAHVPPLAHGGAGHNPAPRTCHQGCSVDPTPAPNSPSMSSPWGAARVFSDLLPHLIPQRGRSLQHCKADLSLVGVLQVGPQPLHTGFLGCNQGENHLQEPPSWYYPQQGRSPSTEAAPGAPAALQGRSIFRQKGKCLYCIPAPPLPSLCAPRWSSWSGAACAAPREDSLLGANGNNLQRTAQPHVMLKGHSAERNASPTRAGLALQRGEGA